MAETIRRRCDLASCRKTYSTTSPQSRYCTDAHKAKARRERKAAETAEQRPATVAAASAVDDAPGDVEVAVVRALEARERLDTWQGQAAVVLARRMDGTHGSAAAALAARLEQFMTAALEGTAPADIVDELGARRDAKLAKYAG